MVQFRIALTLPLLRSHRKGLFTLPAWILAFSIPLVVTGGKWTLTQWVHCEFVVSFEAIRPVVTQQVCGEFF